MYCLVNTFRVQILIFKCGIFFLEEGLQSLALAYLPAKEDGDVLANKTRDFIVFMFFLRVILRFKMRCQVPMKTTRSIILIPLILIDFHVQRQLRIYWRCLPMQ